MSWITAILQLFSQVADLFGNVIVKRLNIRLFDLLALFHYILNLPRMCRLYWFRLKKPSGHFYGTSCSLSLPYVLFVSSIFVLHSGCEDRNFIKVMPAHSYFD